ncbi:MAG: Rieske 2Fe-2S domain-containing protein [Pseudomonadales bacterium]|jgi:phenylpropionate dioxygenase-like ring-hydroxylating dioxygenase large terminal subunit
MSAMDVIARESWFDTETGELDRRVFSDAQIYQEELKKIFARAWNFMCHESQIPEPGNFFLNRIGEDHVIAVRDRKNQVQVLLNSCSHRGNTVCRADQGTTRSFFCPYHGWNYDLDGTLVAIPGEKDFYRNGIDKEALGLVKAAQVSSYKGFVFATLDPSAPPLEEFLGWVGRLGIDSIAARGDIQVVDGIQKNKVRCNWKLAVDNLFDWYHPKVSHGSAIGTGMIKVSDMYPMSQIVILGDYGHGIGGAGVSEEKQAELVQRFQGQDSSEAANRKDYHNAWKTTDKAREILGPVGVRSRGHPNIFPNLWITLGGTQACLRIPCGPLETELWWFTFSEKSMSPEAQRDLIQGATHIFGPAGLLEQDDGENWSHSTRGSIGTVTGSRTAKIIMGKGKDKVIHDPSGQSSIETVINEHAQRWLYQSWQEWMKADSWEDLIENHTPAPTGVV